jgi:hypothetical protein
MKIIKEIIDFTIPMMGEKTIEVEVICLDDYFKNYSGKIDFIKMDIQGSEAGATQGMINLLNKNKNVKIISKFWPLAWKGLEFNQWRSEITSQLRFHTIF